MYISFSGRPSHLINTYYKKVKFTDIEKEGRSKLSKFYYRVMLFQSIKNIQNSNDRNELLLKVHTTDIKTLKDSLREMVIILNY